MTKEQITELIKNKEIPVSFRYNNHDRGLVIFIHKYFTCLDESYPDIQRFDNWKEHNLIQSTNPSIASLPDMTPRLYFCRADGHNFSDFVFIKPTFAECLADFLTWFETNKHNCTNIEYYNI